MRIRIAIADENRDYVERLVYALEDYEDLTISVYTDEKSLNEALVSKRFDVLLFDPTIFRMQTSLKNVVLPIMLLSNSYDVPEVLKDSCKIRKYQRISRIHQQILELFSNATTDIGATYTNKRIGTILVYSPVGGVGKTTRALAVATRLARIGRKTLYINFEDISSEDCYLPQDDSKGLSEIVASLGENINFPLKIQGLIKEKEGNLYYFNHFDSPNDILELQASELQELIEKIVLSGIFDSIVVDMSVTPDDKLRKLMEISDSIVIVEKNDKMAERKLSAFYSQSHLINENIPKMHRVVNFDRGRGSSVTLNIPVVGVVDEVQSPDSAQFISAIASSPCMDFAVKLTE